MDFPDGCCGDASELLSKFLEEHNIRVEYVSGWQGQQSHAWLEYEENVIDITAYQFKHINEKIIITKDKSWHSKFTNQERQYIDFETADAYNKERLRNLYKNITSKIDMRIPVS